MKILNKDTIIKTYRNKSLRSSTPKILRTIYVERTGKISDLTRTHTQDKVEAQFYLNNIKKGFDNDTWVATKEGKDTIETFYKKQSPFGVIKSIIFGVLAKPFQ